jgi:hypothetical protein
MRKVFALTLVILTAVLSGIAYAESPPPSPKTPPVPEGINAPVPLKLTTSGALTTEDNQYWCWVQSEWPHESTTEPGYVHGKATLGATCPVSLG